MDPTHIGEAFMTFTRYRFAVPSDQSLGTPPPALHRRHPRAGENIPLPPVPRVPGDFQELTKARESFREYTETALSLEELSWLLWATQGVKEVHRSGVCTTRTVPSAGSRHPFETYLGINRVGGLAPGLYQYAPLDHAILPVQGLGDLAERLAAACLGQSMLETCAVSFLWTAVPYRTTWRYGQRGYRYLHLDAGHVCQSLYLAAGAIGAGCCAIAAFDDEEMASMLQLDPAKEFVIYLATVGKR